MISACIIAKDEESNIGNCLNSIKDSVDEIIVVDTGSNDNTVKIAKRLGAKTFYKKWNDDFSSARNEALDKASGDWIFVIDCDEILDSSCKNLLRDLAHSSPNVHGYGINITNIINGIESYESAHLRFFRNLPVLRYKGIIHEQISTVSEQMKNSLNFLKSDIKLIHYGYEVNLEVESKKTTRNLTLLTKIPKKERDGMYYFHLGNEYTRLNDIKMATETFLQGYAIADKNQPYFTQLAQKTVIALYSLNAFRECLQYCDDILEKYIDFKSIYFIKSACHVAFNEYQDALSALLIYRSLQSNAFKYPIVNFDSANDIDKMISELQKLVYNNIN